MYGGACGRHPGLCDIASISTARICWMSICGDSGSRRTRRLVAPLPTVSRLIAFSRPALGHSRSTTIGATIIAGSTCEVPVGRPSAADDTWGNARAATTKSSAWKSFTPRAWSPGPLSVLYPIFNEAELHQSLAPNPDSGQGRDDDVDAFDISMSGQLHDLVLLARPRGDGFYPGRGTLDPGAIYEVSALGGIAALDRATEHPPRDCPRTPTSAASSSSGCRLAICAAPRWRSSSASPRTTT